MIRKKQITCPLLLLISKFIYLLCLFENEAEWKDEEGKEEEPVTVLACKFRQLNEGTVNHSISFITGNVF